MSAVGDAMSHAFLLGAALGLLIVGGLFPHGDGLGGLLAGLIVAILLGIVSRTTVLRDDASFASFSLTSLALGVLIVSVHGAPTFVKMFCHNVNEIAKAFASS